MSKPGVGRAVIGGVAMVAFGWGIMKGEMGVLACISHPLCSAHTGTCTLATLPFVLCSHDANR